MKNHNKICLTYNNFDKLLNLALQNCQTKPNFQPNILIETSTPSCTFLSNSLNTINIYDYSKNNSSSSNQLYDTNNCYVIPLSNIFTSKYLIPFSDIKTQLQNIPSSSLIIILLGNLSMSTSPPDQNLKINPSQFSVSNLNITTINGYNTKVIPTTNIPFDLYVYNNDTGGIQTYKNLVRKQNNGYYYSSSFDESDKNQNYVRISNNTFPEILVIGPELNYNCEHGRCLMGGICHYNFQPPDCQKCANNHTYHFENPIPGSTICPKPGESGTCTVAPPCSKCIGNWTNKRCDECPAYRFDNTNGNCDTCMFGWTSTPKPGEITPIPTCDYCPPNYDNSDGTCSNCKAGFKGDKCQFSDSISCSGNGTVDENGKCTCNPGYSGDNCQTKKSLCTPKCTDNTDKITINCGQDDGCGGTCPNTNYNSIINIPLHNLRTAWNIYQNYKPVFQWTNVQPWATVYPYKNPNNPNDPGIYFYKDHWMNQDMFCIRYDDYYKNLQIYSSSGIFYKYGFDNFNITFDKSSNTYIMNQPGGAGIYYLIPDFCSGFIS